MGEVAAQAVELPDDEHVALPHGPQAAVEARPVVAETGGEVVVEVERVDAARPQGVALQVQRLGAVGLRDAGVAEQHVSQTAVCCETSRSLRRTGSAAADQGDRTVLRRTT